MPGKFPDIDIAAIPGVCLPTEPNECQEDRPTYFLIFMCSLILSIFWITYIAFFNSRVVGSVVTRLANSKMIKKLIGDNGAHIEVRQTFFNYSVVEKGKRYAFSGSSIFVAKLMGGICFW